MAKERKTYPGGLVRGAAIPSISFPQFQVVQSDPMPLNILAYEVDFETNDN